MGRSCFNTFLLPLKLSNPLHPASPGPHPQPPARLWKLPSHRVSEVFFLRPYSICGIDSAGCLLKAPGRRLSAAVVPYWSCGVATEVGNGLRNPNTSSRHPATVTHTRLVYRARTTRSLTLLRSFYNLGRRGWVGRGGGGGGQ